MPAEAVPGNVISIHRHAAWSLLEIERPGARPEALGVLLADEETDGLTLRLRPSGEFENLEEQAVDILDFLEADLAGKAREMGARRLLESLEDSLSGFFRVSDRTAIAYAGNPQRTTDRLFDQHVDGAVRPFVTHVPVYALRVAATKFGEGMSAESDEWIRASSGTGSSATKLTEDMFAAWVVGRSMEPLIPDGSLCLFRANVRGTRQGKRLLIEKFDETDFAGRYTVKEYASSKLVTENDEWEHESITLKPLNPEFEAFHLSPDAFRVIAEFVEVLDS